MFPPASKSNEWFKAQGEMLIRKSLEDPNHPIHDEIKRQRRVRRFSLFLTVFSFMGTLAATSFCIVLAGLALFRHGDVMRAILFFVAAVLSARECAKCVSELEELW